MGRIEGSCQQRDESPGRASSGRFLDDAAGGGQPPQQDVSGRASEVIERASTGQILPRHQSMTTMLSPVSSGLSRQLADLRPATLADFHGQPGSAYQPVLPGWYASRPEPSGAWSWSTGFGDGLGYPEGALRAVHERRLRRPAYKNACRRGQGASGRDQTPERATV